MSDSFIQYPLDGGGKRGDSDKLTINTTEVHRARVVAKQDSTDAGAVLTVFDQAVSPSTGYSTNAIPMLVEGYNGITVTVDCAGAGDANVVVEIFPSWDGVTTTSKNIDEFYCFSPRGGATKSAHAVGYAPYPYLIFEIVTEAIAPSSVNIKVCRHNMSSLPTGAGELTFFNHAGSANMGNYRGVYALDTGLMRGSTANGDAVFAIWNPATSSTKIVLESVRVLTRYDSATVGTARVSLEAIRISAEPTAMTTIEAEVTNPKYLTSQSTCYLDANGTAVTPLGGSLWTLPFPEATVHGMPFSILEPGEDRYKTYIEPGHGIAFITPVALTNNSVYSINLIIAEEL